VDRRNTDRADKKNKKAQKKKKKDPEPEKLYDAVLIDSCSG